MKMSVKKAKYGVVLKGIFLFNGIPEEIVDNVYVSSECECVEFLPGEIVFSKHRYRKSLGVVVMGELRAVRQGVNSMILLNSFTQGGVFGAAGLFTEEKEYVSEIRAARKSRVVFLPETLLRELFAQYPLITENYICYLSERIRFLNDKIGSFTGGSAERRVSAFLLDMASKAEAAKFHLAITYTNMAESLNIGRASLYRAMDSLEASGLISRVGKEISILNASGLQERCF